MHKDKRYGRIQNGDTIPYGTLANASKELRMAYYGFGYRNDDDMPPIRQPPSDFDEPYICPEEELFKKELAQIINDVLNTIPIREANILRLRHGFSSNREMSLEEIGNIFDVTRDRIRQVEARAMRRLKHPYRYEVLTALFEPI